MRRHVWLLCAAVLAGCRSAPADDPAPQDAFWFALQSLCGSAYEGQLVQGSPADSVFTGKVLVMHAHDCSDAEVSVAFNVGDDRSRTWVFTRTPDGLRLKHDHRHEDGSEDEITQYGGDTRTEGTSTTQEFYADEHTASLIPAAVTNVWTVEVVPDSMYAYALRREGTDRRVRVEFDLTREIAAPPPSWGH